MINRKQLTEELNISSQEFKELYKQATGKDLGRKQKISQADEKAVREKFGKKDSKKTVIKAEEFGSSSGGFFSGMGIATPTEKTDNSAEKVKNKKKETKEESEPTEIQTDLNTKENAKVISSASKQKQTKKKTKKKIESKKKTSTKTKQDSKKEKTDELLLHAASKASNATVVKKASTRRTQSNPYKRSDRTSSKSSRYSRSETSSRSTPTRKRKDTRSLKEKLQASRKSKATAATQEKKQATTSSTLTKKTEIEMDTSITTKEFSEKMGIPLNQLLKVMMQNKIMGGINTSLDHDTAALIGEEFGVKVKAQEEEIGLEEVLTGDLQAILDIDKTAENLKERPPVVTVMGHVDHGKTSLLDYLRKTNITEGEAGGITQSIGASSITHKDKKITFIDTPGHELFTALRARGAKLTNIAVIVIAADDGIKPQTIESINHAKEADVPIIVAVTKIDKPNTKEESIKTDIGTHGLIPEEWGGDVPVIGVSSKTGEGIEELLEHINLQAEMLELQYNPERKPVGVVVDAHKDPRQGISTSLIVLTGTLRIGDVLVVHNTYGKVKRMLNFQGKPIKEAKGGEPVMILGLNEIPEPGRIVQGVDNEKEAKNQIDLIEQQLNNTGNTGGIQHFLHQIQNDEKAVLKLIVKADGPSSLEAVKHAIDGIVLPKSVDIKIIHNDIGNATDSDLSLAQAAEAIILGFNTKTSSSIKKKAQQLKVTIKNYSIIYELIEYIEQLVHGMIEVEMTEVNIGTMEVLATFFKKEKTMVIGGKVKKGKAQNGALFAVRRDDEEIGKGTITSLQREKNSVKEVAEGYECGLKIKSRCKVEEGDTLQMYVMEEQRIE